MDSNSEIPETSAQNEARSEETQSETEGNENHTTILMSNVLTISLNSDIEELLERPILNYQVNNQDETASDSGDSGMNTLSGLSQGETTRNARRRQRSNPRRRRVRERCPICNELVVDFTYHVLHCSRSSEGIGTESDDDTESNVPEELWNTSVTELSFFQGNPLRQSTMINTNNGHQERFEDVSIYGSAQYFEIDVSNSYRKYINKCSQEAEFAKRLSIISKKNPIVEDLKNKLQELENEEQNRDDLYNCSICMKRYEIPLFSINCGHVHCEKCWLQTLGAKRVCPQCNKKADPTYLRKVCF